MKKQRCPTGLVLHKEASIITDACNKCSHDCDLRLSFFYFENIANLF